MDLQQPGTASRNVSPAAFRCRSPAPLLAEEGRVVPLPIITKGLDRGDKRPLPEMIADLPGQRRPTVGGLDGRAEEVVGETLRPLPG